MLYNPSRQWTKSGHFLLPFLFFTSIISTYVNAGETLGDYIENSALDRNKYIPSYTHTHTQRI